MADNLNMSESNLRKYMMMIDQQYTSLNKNKKMKKQRDYVMNGIRIQMKKRSEWEEHLKNFINL